MDIRTAVQKELDQLHVAILSGGVQGGKAIRLASVDIGALIQQQAADLQLFAGRCRVQRPHVPVVQRRLIHRRTIGDQKGRRLGLAKESRQAQRLETIRRKGAQLLGMLCQQRLQLRQITHRGGGEDIQRSPAPPQQVGDVRLVVIQGRQDRRHPVIDLKIQQLGLLRQQRFYLGVITCLDRIQKSLLVIHASS